MTVSTPSRDTAIAAATAPNGGPVDGPGRPVASLVMASVTGVLSILVMAENTGAVADVGVSVGLAGVPIGEVEDELVRLTGNMNAGECRWLLLLAEVERRGSWQQGGFRSVSQWLSARLGIAGRTARSKLAVARKLADLPATTDAFGAGRLSFSQVRAISRAMRAGPDPAREAALLQLAQGCAADQLERVCDQHRGQTTAEADDAERATSLNALDDGVGTVTVTVTLPRIDAQRLLAAVDRRVQAEPVSTDRTVALVPLAKRRALALVDAAVTAVGEPVDRPAVVLHVGLADYEAGRGGTLQGRPVAQAVIDRYLDDAMVSAVVFDDDGRPVMAGTQTRRGDGPTRRVELHHVDYWDVTKRTTVDGLVALCRPCHTFHHGGGLRITKTIEGGLEFTGPDGQPHRPLPVTGSVYDLEQDNSSRGVEIDSAHVGPEWDGGRLDPRWIDLPGDPPPRPTVDAGAGATSGPAGPPPAKNNDEDDSEIAVARYQLDALYEQVARMRERDTNDPAIDRLYRDIEDLEDYIATLEAGPHGLLADTAQGGPAGPPLATTGAAHEPDPEEARPNPALGGAVTPEEDSDANRPPWETNRTKGGPAGPPIERVA